MCNEDGGSLQSAEGMDVCVKDSRGVTLDNYSIMNLKRGYESFKGLFKTYGYDYICTYKLDNGICNDKVHVQKKTKGGETVFFTKNGGLPLTAELETDRLGLPTGHASSIHHPQGIYYDLN